MNLKFHIIGRCANCWDNVYFIITDNYDEENNIYTYTYGLLLCENCDYNKINKFFKWFPLKKSDMKTLFLGMI